MFALEAASAATTADVSGFRGAGGRTKERCLPLAASRRALFMLRATPLGVGLLSEAITHAT
jgi:hypothetical protein